MGALSRSGDLVYTMRFLTLLTTPFEDTGAFKEGHIDSDGERIKKPKTSKEKEVYNYFHRLVFNVKKLIGKVPGGKKKISSYAAALYLIKEKSELGDESIEQILKQLEIDTLDFIEESTDHWYCRDGLLSPGSYRLDVDDKLVNSTCEDLCKKGDKVTVEFNCHPAGNMFGLDIYEVIHTSTHQKIYVTAGELSR
jgi:hypothetical protein